jgi:hypothetical protein
MRVFIKTRDQHSTRLFQLEQPKALLCHCKWVADHATRINSLYYQQQEGNGSAPLWQVQTSNLQQLKKELFHKVPKQ